MGSFAGLLGHAKADRCEQAFWSLPERISTEPATLALLEAWNCFQRRVPAFQGPVEDEAVVRYLEGDDPWREDCWDPPLAGAEFRLSRWLVDTPRGLRGGVWNGLGAGALQSELHRDLWFEVVLLEQALKDPDPTEDRLAMAGRRAYFLGGALDSLDIQSVVGPDLWRRMQEASDAAAKLHEDEAMLGECGDQIRAAADERARPAPKRAPHQEPTLEELRD